MPARSNRRLRLLQNDLRFAQERVSAERDAAAERQRSPADLGPDCATPDVGSSRSATPPNPRPAGNRFDPLLLAARSCESQAVLRTGASPLPPQEAPAASGRGNPPPHRCKHDLVLVLDFECTCDLNECDWPHEIIEFPVVAVDTATMRVVAEFHSYVRPLRNPILTPFCTELTGITQAQVDAAPPLPDVLAAFDTWLRTVAPEGRSAVLATDGPWDLRDFMFKHSVQRDGHRFPPFFYRWLNVRKTYASFFRIKPIGVGQMLTRLGLTFQGREHSGIDDARNIARIVLALLRRGCDFTATSSLPHPDDRTEHVLDLQRELLEEEAMPRSRSREETAPGRGKGNAKAKPTKGRRKK